MFKIGVYWDLFITFLKIGLFTFGGGWAMLAIMEREVVDKHKWMEREDYLDMLSLIQSLPGIMAVNMAVAVGDRIRGVRASCFAALGVILPSFLIILAVAIFLTPEDIVENETLNAVFKGIRPAVVALIISPMISAGRAAKLTYKTIVIPIGVALLIYSGIPVVSNPILYVVIGAVVGYLLHVRGVAKIKNGK
ncbi:MAG: chromate transporter [Bacteroidales bacterium]